MLRLLFFIIYILSLCDADTNQTFIRPCYFDNWSKYRASDSFYSPDYYIPGLCTHIYYAEAIFNVSTFDPLPTDANDTTENGGYGLYEKFNALKQRDKNLKTSLSFGGWSFSNQNDTPFSKMINTTENRAAFIDKALTFLRKYEFDGIDIDWEFPQGDEEKEKFNEFLKELQKAVVTESLASSQDRLIITVAVGQKPVQNQDYYNISGMAPYVDYINVMTYEFHNFAQQNYTGFNSPLFGRNDDYPNETTSNIKDAVQYYVDNGMRKDQIIVGFPTFGRGWTLLSENDTGVHAPCIGKSNGTRYFGWGGGATYADICDMLSKGARRVFDNEAKVPYLVLGKQWFSYDDEESYQIKLNWLKSNGYAGAFVWSLGMDDFLGVCYKNGTKYPLIATIAKELGGIDINKPSNYANFFKFDVSKLFLCILFNNTNFPEFGENACCSFLFDRLNGSICLPFKELRLKVDYAVEELHPNGIFTNKSSVSMKMLAKILIVVFLFFVLYGDKAWSYGVYSGYSSYSYPSYYSYYSYPYYYGNTNYYSYPSYYSSSYSSYSSFSSSYHSSSLSSF